MTHVHEATLRNSSGLDLYSGFIDITEEHPVTLVSRYGLWAAANICYSWSNSSVAQPIT
jgi:hypothetical protein